jgi:hypothetical protein
MTRYLKTYAGSRSPKYVVSSARSGVSHNTDSQHLLPVDVHPARYQILLSLPKSASKVVHDIRKTVVASSSRGQRDLVLGVLKEVRVFRW